MKKAGVDILLCPASVRCVSHLAIIMGYRGCICEYICFLIAHRKYTKYSDTVSDSVPKST